LVKTNRSRRSLDNSDSQNKKSFFSERIFVIFTYSCLVFLAGFLIYGYYAFIYTPPRDTLIQIDSQSYNAIDISREMGFASVYKNEMNTALESLLSRMPNLLKNEYILNEFGAQLVGTIDEDEIRFRAVKLLSIKEDSYKENSLILDETLSNIRDKSQISRDRILSYAKSTIIQERLKGIFSEEVGTTSELVFIKRIDIDGEAEAATFFADYEAGQNISSLIDEYNKVIQLQEIGWRIRGYTGIDIPLDVNSLDLNKLSGPVKDGRKSYFYYFDKINKDGLVTEPILDSYSKMQIYNFIQLQIPNINYLELNVDASLGDYIVRESGKLRLALGEQALENINQEWSYSVR
tara:strand:+ start:2469 stop:3515 length:1047 start_codon:yes stop_codon:yes gene_type:complete